MYNSQVIYNCKYGHGNFDMRLRFVFPRSCLCPGLLQRYSAEEKSNGIINYILDVQCLTTE